MEKKKKTVTKLWIGGTSGLARTYFNAFSVGNNQDDDNNIDNDSSHPHQQQQQQQEATATATDAAANENQVDQASNWLILGLETSKPAWLPFKTRYISCDLTTLRSTKQATEFWTRHGGGGCRAKNNDNGIRSVTAAAVQQIVISIRPPLLSPWKDSLRHQYASNMLSGLEYLLGAIFLLNTSCRHEQQNAQQIVHISSIAAVDHIRRQCLWSETDPDPDSQDLDQPYDRFKRASEELVERLVRQQQQQPLAIEYTNLRFGAIFSDTPTCIQCTALALQARIGPYMNLPIDCNSARNASILLRCILQRFEEPSANSDMQQQQQPPLQTLRPVYFYTRPLQYRNPVPYGEYLVAYRRAHDMRFVLWLPICVVHGFVSGIHLVSQVIGKWVPYVQSIDYLLQVTKDEHSFASQAVMEDFPQLASQEETIEACFRRRSRQLLLDAKKTSVNNKSNKKKDL